VYVPCRRPARFAPLTFLVLGALGAVSGRATPSDKRPEPPDAIAIEAESSPGLLLLDEVLEPLPPDRRRTEAEQDDAEALALFSAGRMLEWQSQYAEALRFYQRALRYDPGAGTVAEALVRLAIQLERYDEAIRVAAKLSDPDALGPVQWMKLGVHLIKKGDWHQALAMYENVLATRKNADKTSGDVALRMELGRLYHLADEYAKAADQFAWVREALASPEQFGLDEAAARDLLGEPGSAYLLMGNCFLRCDRIEEAVAAFEESDRAAPNKGLLACNLAQVDAQRGKPADALAKLQACFDEHLASEGVAPYALLGRVLKDLGKDDELIDRLEKLRAADPDNVPLGYFLAETYHKAQQLDKAESLYRALAAKTPTVTGYRGLVAIYRKTDRPEALLQVLGEAAADGVAAESLGQEGRSIADDGDLVRALVEIARKRHHDAPDQLGYDLRLAVALLALEAHELDAANQFFDLAIQADPNRASETLITWGLGLLDHDEYAPAAQVFQRGIDEKVLPDDNPIFYHYLSLALELDGRIDDALAAARKAAELDPKSPRFLSRVAWILHRDERQDQAAEIYTELIDKFDSDFSSALVRQVMRESRLVLSNLAVLADDYPRAEEWLEQVLDEFPDDIAALNDLGYLWADRNVRLQRAYRMIREAVEGDPDNVAYRDSLGWVLYRLGRPEEALVELEKAASGDEPDPVILDHLGDVYHATNQPDKARRAWQRAVEAFQEKKDAEKAKTVQQKIGNSP